MARDRLHAVDVATRSSRVHRDVLGRPGPRATRDTGGDQPARRWARTAAEHSAVKQVLRRLAVCMAVWLAAAPGVGAQDARSADWLRTVRETPLWSGAADPS